MEGTFLTILTLSVAFKDAAKNIFYFLSETCIFRITAYAIIKIIFEFIVGFYYH